jgi:hypothetical protein
LAGPNIRSPNRASASPLVSLLSVITATLPTRVGSRPNRAEVRGHVSLLPDPGAQPGRAGLDDDDPDVRSPRVDQRRADGRRESQT